VNDLEQEIRDDLIAAGIDPDKYLGKYLGLGPQPRIKEKKSDPDQNLYFCEKCDQGWYHWNLRFIDGQWICVKCAGLWKERLEFSAWRKLQREKSANE